MSSVTTLINQEFIDQMPGLFVALDFDSRFLVANKTALQWTGFKSYDDMVNTTYHDMPCKASEQHTAFVNQDKTIFSRNGHGRILGFYCYNNDDWKIILAEKYPLVVAGKMVALGSYISDISHTNTIDIAKFLLINHGKKSVKFLKQQTGYMIEEKHALNILTPRELECLFFIIRGKNIREVAELFFISKRTVEKHIENIKIKFGCVNKAQLIEKAIAQGYLNQIPETLFEMFK